MQQRRARRRSSSRENLATLRSVDDAVAKLQGKLDGKVTLNMKDATLRVDGAVDIPIRVTPGVSQRDLETVIADDRVKVHVEPGPHRTSVWFMRIQKAEIVPWSTVNTALVAMGVVCFIISLASIAMKWYSIQPMMTMMMSRIGAFSNDPQYK